MESKNKRISIIVFVFTMVIVGINFVSILFPALLVTVFIGSEGQINSFESGAWALPALIANGIIFYFGVLYFTKKLPSKIHNAFHFIRNFEISRRVSVIVILLFLGIYIAFTVQDLSLDERSEWIDFVRLEPIIEDFPHGEGAITAIKMLYVKNFLLYSSNEVFDNVKIIPFIGSISLLVLTYFFTAKIANKRFAGIIAMVVLLQSHTFLKYDTSATYANFWTLFYLLSLYTIYNKWYVSPVSYILSIFSKPLSIVFLPMTLFFTYQSKIPRRKKIKVAISYGIVLGVMATGLLILDIDIAGEPPKEIFNNLGFWSSFTTVASMLRLDGIILLFLPSLTVGLFLISRKGIPIANAILFLIGGILFSTTLLAAFTGYNLAPYRYMPLIVFFAIGVGTLFSERLFDRS